MKICPENGEQGTYLSLLEHNPKFLYNENLDVKSVCVSDEARLKNF